MLGDHDVRSIQLAVADNLHLGDLGDLLTDQLEYGAAEVAGDPTVGCRAAQSLVQKCVIESLPA